MEQQLLTERKYLQPPTGEANLYLLVITTSVSSMRDGILICNVKYKVPSQTINITIFILNLTNDYNKNIQLQIWNVVFISYFFIHFPPSRLIINVLHHYNVQIESLDKRIGFFLIKFLSGWSPDVMTVCLQPGQGSQFSVSVVMWVMSRLSLYWRQSRPTLADNSQAPGHRNHSLCFLTF